MAFKTAPRSSHARHPYGHSEALKTLGLLNRIPLAAYCLAYAPYAVCAIAGLAMLSPILFHPGLPAYRQDWSWPFTARDVLTGELNQMSTWNPEGLGSPNALASNNILNLLMAGPAFIMGGVGAAKITLCFAVIGASLSAAWAARRTTDATASSAVAAGVLYITLPPLVNKIGAGHVAWWLAYAILPLIYERAVEFGRHRALAVLAQLALLQALSVVQPQFALFGFVACVGGALGSGASAALAVGAASLFGSVVSLAPSAVAFWASRSYIAWLYQAPRVAWEATLSSSLGAALWTGGYFAQYYQRAVAGHVALAQAACAGAVCAFAALPRRQLTGILLVFTVGVLFVSGTLGPAASIWRYLFAHVAAATAFRELYDASCLTALAYSLAVASLGRIRYGQYAAVLLAAISAAPFAAGALSRVAPNVVAPSWSSEAMLHRFQPGRVAAFPLATPLSLDGRTPGGVDVLAPRDATHPSLSEYPTLFPLTVQSLSHCYCEAWFVNAMERDGVSTVLNRGDLSSLDLARQGFGAPSAPVLRSLHPDPLVSAYRRAVQAPLLATIALPRDTVGIEDARGPFPGNQGVDQALALPQPTMASDDPRLGWSTLERSYARSASPYAMLPYGVTTSSNMPLHMSVPAGRWSILYAATSPVVIRASTRSRRLPASVRPTWASIASAGSLSIANVAGVATVFRVARGGVRLPYGSYAAPPAVWARRAHPWEVDISTTATARPILLVFRERYAAGWTIHGARTLWHGVADGYANAYVIKEETSQLTIRYDPQHTFWIAAFFSWCTELLLLPVATLMGCRRPQTLAVR